MESWKPNDKLVYQCIHYYDLYFTDKNKEVNMYDKIFTFSNKMEKRIETNIKRNEYYVQEIKKMKNKYKYSLDMDDVVNYINLLNKQYNETKALINFDYDLYVNISDYIFSACDLVYENKLDISAYDLLTKTIHV